MCHTLGRPRVTYLLPSVTNTWLTTKNCFSTRLLQPANSTEGTNFLLRTRKPHVSVPQFSLQLCVITKFYKCYCSTSWRSPFQNFHHFHIPSLNSFCMIQLLFVSLKKWTQKLSQVLPFLTKVQALLLHDRLPSCLEIPSLILSLQEHHDLCSVCDPH